MVNHGAISIAIHIGDALPPAFLNNLDAIKPFAVAGNKFSGIAGSSQGDIDNCMHRLAGSGTEVE